MYKKGLIEGLCLALVVIVLEAIMYYTVGEEVLTQRGPLRTISILLPSVVLAPSIIRDIVNIIKKDHMDKKNNKKK